MGGRMDRVTEWTMGTTGGRRDFGVQTLHIGEVRFAAMS
jgi:hypothetical protein